MRELQCDTPLLIAMANRAPHGIEPFIDWLEYQTEVDFTIPYQIAELMTRPKFIAALEKYHDISTAEHLARLSAWCASHIE